MLLCCIGIVSLTRGYFLCFLPDSASALSISSVSSDDSHQSSVNKVYCWQTTCIFLAGIIERVQRTVCLPEKRRKPRLAKIRKNISKSTVLVQGGNIIRLAERFENPSDVYIYWSAYLHERRRSAGFRSCAKTDTLPQRRGESTKYFNKKYLLLFFC